MYDSFTLDQLRALSCVVEEGSFSAAARKLRRVQSAVSTAMKNLEDGLGVPIWDRSTKVATLTPQGRAILASARRILLEADSLRRLTTAMGTGLEPQVSLCVDALFPVGTLTDVCVRFAKEFPSVDLRVDTQVMSAVTERVRSGAATLGVVSQQGLVAGLERRPIGRVRMIPLVGPRHPLAAMKGPIPESRLADAVQIVLSERVEAGVSDQGVLSPRTWRVADLATKIAMMRANLGWGNLPEPLVAADVAAGRLVRIRPRAVAQETDVHLYLVYRSDATFGPAHEWLERELEVHASGTDRDHRRKR